MKKLLVAVGLLAIVAWLAVATQARGTCDGENAATAAQAPSVPILGDLPIVGRMFASQDPVARPNPAPPASSASGSRRVRRSAAAGGRAASNSVATGVVGLPGPRPPTDAAAPQTLAAQADPFGVATTVAPEPAASDPSDVDYPMAGAAAAPPGGLGGGRAMAVPARPGNAGEPSVTSTGVSAGAVSVPGAGGGARVRSGGVGAGGGGGQAGAGMGNARRAGSGMTTGTLPRAGQRTTPEDAPRGALSASAPATRSRVERGPSHAELLEMLDDLRDEVQSLRDEVRVLRKRLQHVEKGGSELIVDATGRGAR